MRCEAQAFGTTSEFRYILFDKHRRFTLVAPQICVNIQNTFSRHDRRVGFIVILSSYDADTFNVPNSSH